MTYGGVVRSDSGRVVGGDEQLGWRIARWASRCRTAFPLVLLDSTLCVSAYIGALMLRFDGDVTRAYWKVFWAFLPIAIAAHLVSNWLWRLDGAIWKHASVHEARHIALAGTTALAALLVFVSITESYRVPISVVLLGGLLSTLLMGALRFHSRLFALRRHDGRSVHRVAVLGAGEAGAGIVREMLRNPRLGLHPAVVLDDDPRKIGKSLQGVRIVGRIDELAALAGTFDIHQALLAIPSADKELVSRALEASAAVGVPLKVLPGVSELVRGPASVRDARQTRIEDLLGRAQVETDLDAVQLLLAGRRVLVTGAGGSIGSEIVRQVAASGADEIVALDHDDTHLHEIAGQTDGQIISVLADVRHREHLQQIFRRYRPEVVFHAAAYKHVPILETHACEAASTNVLGTKVLLETAAASGVQHLVVISTDKAVCPSSVMGASKWMGEQLMLAMAPPEGRYCAVRFGNVLGSRGSVIPTFTSQIAAGGPVTVTHRDMTRYFMSIPEAVQLVLQAAAMARGHDIFMLDMGEPVRIMDLARRMITLAGREPGTDIEIRVTGMRPGEKLAEELRAPGEDADATQHPSILRVHPLPVPDAVLIDAVQRLSTSVQTCDEDEAARILRDLPAAYTDYGRRVAGGLVLEAT